MNKSVFNYHGRIEGLSKFGSKMTCFEFCPEVEGKYNFVLEDINLDNFKFKLAQFNSLEVEGCEFKKKIDLKNLETVCKQFYSIEESENNDAQNYTVKAEDLHFVWVENGRFKIFVKGELCEPNGSIDKLNLVTTTGKYKKAGIAQ